MKPAPTNVVGLVIAWCWLAAYERHTAAYELRMALANEAEPEQWRLLRDRGQQFARGDEVDVQGTPH